MRYNSENVSEMSTRLTYLVDCFSKSAEKNSQQLYVGPKVDRSEQLRLQDFLRFEQHEEWARCAERLSKDLLQAAQAQGKMAEVTPVMIEAANVIRTFPPQYQNIPSMKGLIVG